MAYLVDGLEKNSLWREKKTKIYFNWTKDLNMKFKKIKQIEGIGVYLGDWGKKYICVNII